MTRHEDHNARNFRRRIARLSRVASNHADDDTRFRMAEELLIDALELAPDCPGANIASWNIARTGTHASDGRMPFERNMPLLIRPGCYSIVDFFCCIALLRDIIDSLIQRARRGSPVSWGHFIMGAAPKKVIIHADLQGTAAFPGVMKATYHSREKEDGLGILDVRIGAAWLADVRNAHAELSARIHDLAGQASKLLKLEPVSPPDSPEASIYLRVRVSDLVHVMRQVLDISPEGKSKIKEGLLDMAAPLVSAISAIEFEDHALAQMGDAFYNGANADIEGILPVARQMLFHAFVCPCPRDVPFLAYIPDVSYFHSKSAKELSSLALQAFLTEPLRLNAPEWQIWASLVSMVGREKTVHDYSELKEKQGWMQAQIDLSHELPSVLDSMRQYAPPRELLKINYVDLAVRVLSRKLLKSWPGDLAAMFTPDGLAENTFLMAYPRAKDRNWIPNNANGVLWDDARLWEAHAEWLDYSIAIPNWISPEHLSGRYAQPVACYAAFWVYFLLISAQMHAIHYAFPVGVRDEWDGSNLGDERARVELEARESKDGWHLIISNRGSRDVTPPDIVRGSSADIVEDHAEHVIDRQRVVLKGFRFDPHYAGQGGWIAEIIGKKEREEPS